MRRLRPLLLVIPGVIIALVIILAFPTSRFLLLGAIRQENFHNDRPVSHWEYLLEDENELVRKEAAFNLGSMGEDSRRAVPALGRALKDPSEKVRINASLALQKIGRSSAGAAVELGEALGDSHELVRLNAAMTLILCGPAAQPAVPAIIAAMDEPRNAEVVIGPNQSVRQRCAIALGRIGPGASKGVPALVDALKDPHYGTRQEAAKSLGAIGQDARVSIPHLRRLLDDKEEVRQRAKDALKALGEDPDKAAE